MEVAEETVVKIPCATIGHMEQQIAVNIKFRDVTYSVPGAAGRKKKKINITAPLHNSECKNVSLMMVKY